MLKCLPAGGCHVRRGTAVITGGPRLRQDIYHHPEDPVSDPGTPDHPGEASGDHLYQRSGSIHEAALCADISTGSAYRQFWNISFCFLSNPAPVGQNFIRQYFKRQTKRDLILPILKKITDCRKRSAAEVTELAGNYLAAIGYYKNTGDIENSRKKLPEEEKQHFSRIYEAYEEARKIPEALILRIC